MLLFDSSSSPFIWFAPAQKPGQNLSSWNVKMNGICKKSIIPDHCMLGKNTAAMCCASPQHAPHPRVHAVEMAGGLPPQSGKSQPSRRRPPGQRRGSRGTAGSHGQTGATTAQGEASQQPPPPDSWHPPCPTIGNLFSSGGRWGGRWLDKGKPSVKKKSTYPGPRSNFSFRRCIPEFL